MKYIVWTLIVILVLAMLPVHSYAADPNRLIGTQWKLLRYGAENAPTVPVGEQAITLNFGADSIGGSGGCNTYGGSYRADGTAISFSNIFSTLIACEPEEITKQEQAYFRALRKATQFRFADGLLIIRYGADETLVFTRLLNFADSTWQLVAIETPDGQVSLAENVTINLELTAESATGSSGCNTYRAVPTYREDSISFRQITSTRMACAEMIMALERAYLDALSTVQSYRVVNGQLVLLYGTTGRLILDRVPTFTGVAWRLVAYGTLNALTPVEGRVSLTFSQGRASGSTGCNQYNASFTARGDSLSFSTLIATRRACPTAALSQQEQIFLKALERVTHYSQRGDELSLHYGAGERLVFKPIVVQ
ncbi:MAG: META domain-containing protein [Anaerolineae bacterium]|nr:META domain-containing protein [Anaerolineae bacterium]